MRCWPIEITLGGRVFDIPALSAIEWWPVLVSGDLTSILDFVVSTTEESFSVDDLLLEGNLSQGELGEALIDALEATAGRSFHASMVLATLAGQHWASINGALVRRGFRWEDQPLAAALDAIYAEVTGRLEKEPLDKLLALLDNEALTTGKPTARQRANLTNEFESMAGPRPTAGVRSTGAPSDSARPKTQPRPRPPRQAARSHAPTEPRAPRAGNGPAASSGSLAGAGGPASGIAPHPPL